ncbi:linear amide C-N hydrolase [Proteus penneri]|uniref:Linear amide C-N hydrolase n=1 Tax=Proteus penneri TaxID=102862 RepID=A0ABS0W090_9GAMM|nr:MULTISPECIES: linear amide C-N hydrolase [Proteus]EEG83486.1 linear amide C-N hydrolase, choloylglycine hydrolase family protein [Proteus penneri ATCC 35198]MBJ2116300.1 linear amide C-N hydrolase [Proteus penneri]NBM13312.1 linear amide C-N hydrolase [Proteus sp. G2670]NBM32849.1 linear amide C-N hydrolase [Proteus sp. G2664]NBM69272.1 linear amide C-N hydrolase [Proteus sp. G2663]
MSDDTINAHAFACTTLAIKDKKNRIYHGRTMEFSVDKPASIFAYYPKAHTFQQNAPDGTPGLKYAVKYPFIAITAPINLEGTKDVLEGVNTEGLSFSLNMLPDSKLDDLSPENYATSVPIAAIGEWALAQYATVEELKQNIPKTAFWSQKLLLLHNLPSPFHYAFYDKTGDCIVVEVSEGKLHIYDNPTYCMTNGPLFPWHLTNLNNYTHLSNINISTSTLGHIKVRQPDSGIALATLPSSDTSVDRFIRAVYYTTYYHQVFDQDTQLVELAHIMNRFDRPKNSTIDPLLGHNTLKALHTSEFSVWTTLTDLERGILLFRGYNDLNFQKFTLESFKNEVEPIFIKVNLGSTL